MMMTRPCSKRVLTLGVALLLVNVIGACMATTKLEKEEDVHHADTAAKGSSESWAGWAKDKISESLTTTGFKGSSHAGGGDDNDDDDRLTTTAAKMSKDKIMDAATGGREYASEVKDAAAEEGREVKDKAGEAAEEAKAKAGEKKEKAEERARQAKDRAAEEAKETEKEAEEHVGWAKDKAKQGYEAVKEKVGEAYESARDSVEAGGRGKSRDDDIMKVGKDDVISSSTDARDDEEL